MLKVKALSGRLFKLIGVLAVVMGLVYGLVSSTYVDELARGFVLVTALADRDGGGVFDPGLTDPYTEFGVTTNSRWALNYTLRIVPLFSYEGIVNHPVYPAAVLFAPFPGDSAYVVLGRAAPWNSVVFLNWRYTEDGTMSDEADALGTLTHELIHVQGGIFSGGTSEELEAATAAATTEVLAALCNFGDRIACTAFLDSVQDGVRAVLIRDLQMYHAEWAWQAYANLFMRNETERLVSAKALRYWASDPAARQAIIQKYGVVPLENYIAAGIKGKVVDAAYHSSVNPSGWFGYDFGLLSFDDTKIALARLRGPLAVVVLSTYDSSG